jgi:hypothetical protein
VRGEVAACDTADVRDAFDVDAQMQLGDACARVGEYEKAIAHWSLTVAITPDGAVRAKAAKKIRDAQKYRGSAGKK